ncbi:MAG TPA: hypothetical protein O0X01_07085 [Methanocorpusculum sp.]|nr:hypothetical protein [Methanocorpusculum sp.]
MLRLITERSGQNAVKLVEITGKSRSSVERYLRILKADGKVEFRGADKKR